MVFYALKAQIEANELTRIQFQKQENDERKRKNLAHLLEQVNIIRNEINEFGFVLQESQSSVPVSYKGASAIERLANSLPNMISHAQGQGADPFKYIPLLNNIKILLESILNLQTVIKSSEIDIDDRDYLLSILSYQYSSKIRIAFESKIEKYRVNDFVFNFTNETSESVFTDRLFSIITNINSNID
ncbi:hypothetical protein MUN84_04275 [Hymenobacter sp. 5516J-16]|uniref:hypothetical protein n=1 Tax=Hymenobacter sp. 5516J-16 TaxID=2932253 RepID=UPI001FD62221|nr:hypothetical protein [Hymenobacter sp. 5516J-16]UOQ77872.1 hypothetical protein MUN84_04275 [Hymenobacter sp. 5516J-16]